MKTPLMCLLFVSTAAYALTPAEMEAAQVAAWKGRTSVRMEREDWSDESNGRQKNIVLRIENVEMLRKGDVWVTRVEAEHRHDESGKKYGSSSVLIGDGEFVYSTHDEGFRKQTRKYEAEPLKGDVPRPEPIWPVSDEWTFEVLPNETISGVECFSYAVTPKKRPKLRSKYCVGIKDGVRYFTERTNLEGVVVMRTTVKSVVFNPELSPDRFKFIPEPGVEIIDKTKKK